MKYKNYFACYPSREFSCLESFLRTSQRASRRNLWTRAGCSPQGHPPNRRASMIAQTILRLRYKAPTNTIGSREAKWRRRLSRRLGTICYNSLERGSLLHGKRGREKQSAGCVEPALPNLLAADFYVRLPTRLFSERCAGSDPGFLPYGS